MFHQTSSLRRRVSISHECGELLIRIQRPTEYASAIFNLIFVLFFLGFLGWIFVPAFSHRRSFTELLYVAPAPALLIAVYIGMLRWSLVAAFGVEEVVVSHGTLCCTQHALLLTRNIEVACKDVLRVTAKARFGGWGRVDIATRRRTFSIGKRILADEAKDIAEALRKAGIG